MQTSKRQMLINLFVKRISLTLVLFALIFSLTTVYTYTRAGGPTRAYAATSSNLNFQARLLAGSGALVADGNYYIEFNLYTAESGGSSVWRERYQGSAYTCDFGTGTGNTNNRVSVKNGYLSVNLGHLCTFPSTINWDQEHWLTMNVGGSGGAPAYDGEMSPRLKLTAVPYSFRSALAGALTNGSGSLTAADFLQRAPAAPQSVSSTVAGLRFDQVGSGGLVQLRGDGVDVFTVDKTGSGYFKGSLDIDAALTAGGGNAFSVNTSGDITSVFTALNGTSTTNGAAVLASTSLTLNDATNFDVGNYVQVNSANCGGTGINPCYAKITAKAANTLTITPGLTWANGSTVNEYHIPELGGTNTAQTLANRYGRGYFIAGVATGNGTTYYNEGDITTSLDTFNLLNTGVTTLNIGGEATTISIGSAGTTVSLPGALSVQGATLDVGTATQAGGLVIQNGSAKTGTIVVGTLAANRTYTLPDADGTICLTTTCTGGGGPTDAFVKDGNNFGVTTVLGTNDNFGLAFETNAIQRVLIDASGNIGIGTSSAPSQLLSVGGTTGNFTVNSAGAVTSAGLTSSSGLSVTADGASITGGLNNNDGGITNTGSITGVGTDITALAGLTIASGGTSDLTLNSASGLLILGAGTLQTLDNLALDLAKATDTSLTLQNSGAGVANLNLLDGGLYSGGTQRISNTGALQNITGLTVISGGANITGNITLGGSSSDRLTIIGQFGGASPLVFQGVTDNGFATTIGVTDPTANNTITLPDGSGVIVLDTRSILTAAGSGLSGGGNLSSDRSLSLDINGLTSKTNNNPLDYLSIYDDTTSSVRKISRNDFLQGLIGALVYRGTWDASTNTPTLADNTGVNGNTYVVSVAGSENFGSGPAINFGVGDFVIHNGTDWERAPSSADVTSVFGRTGLVTAQNGDYTGLQITNTPAGSLSATNVQAALNELANEKLGSLNGLTAITQTFANDTNIMITSSGSTHTLGWAGLLTVARGGTGVGTFTTNGILYGNGTGALQDTAAGTGGQLLLADATGVPTFTTMSGDVTISSAGLATIGANTINLATDTVGNYVANLGTLTGLTTTGNTGEGSTPTLSVAYGSLANTAVQGNTGLTITAGTNLSGGGAITLGTGGAVTLNIIANPTFGTSVTTPLLTSAAGLSITSGGTGDITLDSASNKLVVAATDTTLERTAAGSYTIDLKDNATTTLVLSNSSPGGSSFADLNLADGDLLIGGVSVLTSARALDNLTGITNTGLLTSSGGIINLNVGTNFATNINTGSSTGTITIGGGTAPLVINSTNFDVSATGGLSGITGYSQLSGSFAVSGAGTFSIDSSAFDVSSTGALSGISTINASGLVTSVGLNAGSGLIQGTGGLTITGAISVDGALSDPTSNLVLDDIVDIGSATTGLRVGADGSIIDIDASIVLNDQVLLGSSTTGLQVTTAGIITDIDGASIQFGENVTVSAGGITVTGNSTITGTLTGLTGLTVASGGASITGGLNNNSGGITNAGAISGATTLSLSGAITGATATNTINGLIINSGSLSGITGYSQLSGSFAVSGAGTFSIDSSAFDVSSTGALSGISTISNSGTITSGGRITANAGLTVTTGQTLTVNGDGFSDLTGSGLQNTTGVLTVNSATTGTTAVTSSNSGIEVTSGGIRLLGGCANTQILKWGTAGGGAWACAADATGISDIRAKKNIETVEGMMLDKIKDIRIVEFDYNCESPAFGYQYCDTTHQTGVIAQELAQVFPELVVQDEHGYYSVRYDALAIYNLKAVGELAQKIKSNGDASLNNVTAQGLTVNGVLEAGTIRADRIEGLDYLGRIDDLEANIDTVEARLAAVEQNQSQNINLSDLTVGKLTASGDTSVQKLTVNLDLVAKGSMIVDGQATFKEAVRFEKDVLLEGEINVLGYANVQGLTVNLDLIVKGAMVIDGKATFKEAVRFEKDVVFEKDVAVKGQTTFNKDTAGYVTIKQGEATAKVTFATPKARKPVIALTLGEGKFAQYSYRNVTEEGFEIILLTPATEDLSFSWVAIQTEEVAEAPAP